MKFSVLLNYWIIHYCPLNRQSGLRPHYPLPKPIEISRRLISVDFGLGPSSLKQKCSVCLRSNQTNIQSLLILTVLHWQTHWLGCSHLNAFWFCVIHISTLPFLPHLRWNRTTEQIKLWIATRIVIAQFIPHMHVCLNAKTLVFRAEMFTSHNLMLLQFNTNRLFLQITCEA